MIKQNNKKWQVVIFGLSMFFACPYLAMAGYEDNETVQGNSFSALSLDAKVSSTQTGLEAAVDAAKMLPGKSVSRDVKIENAGSGDFQYKVKFEKITGDDALCAALQLTAKKDNTSVYTGNLSGLDFDAGNLSAVNDNAWNFVITLPAGSSNTLENLDCNFKFAFTAWQTGIGTPTQGWIDNEELSSNNIHAGDWTAPAISDMKASDPVDTKGSGNDIKVSITWTTDENATSNVVYDTVSHSAGTPTDYSSSAPTTTDVAADNTAHNVQLTGLSTYDTYYYRSVSKDATGNEAYSAESSFATSTPVSSTPGEIVMNEFVPNPLGDDSAVMPAGEWIEMYNNTSTDKNIAGWYFKDAGGNKLIIAAANSDNDGDTTDAGETIIPAGSYLVTYLDSNFSLNNGGDTIYFYDDKGTPSDESNDVLMDEYTYGDTSTFDEGKTIARIPDGTGPWIDPDGTPGEENGLGEKETAEFRLMTSQECFDSEGNVRESEESICNPDFLEYLGMLEDKDDQKMSDEMYQEFLKSESESDAKDDVGGDKAATADMGMDYYGNRYRYSRYGYRNLS